LESSSSLEQEKFAKSTKAKQAFTKIIFDVFIADTFKNFKTNVKNLINKIKKEGGHTPDDAIPKKKSGGSMDPYYGSYIKGTVDGHELSNPTYRKYYKGLI